MKPKDWFRNGYVHVALWLFVLGLAAYWDVKRGRFFLLRFIAGMMLMAVAHEWLHHKAAQVLGWKSRFILGRRTYWQPAVALDPPSILWSRHYTLIALAPLLPSILIGWIVSGWIGATVAATMSGMDLRFLLQARGAEKDITQWLCNHEGRNHTA